MMISNIRKKTCQICSCEDSPIFLNLTIQENGKLRKIFNDLFPFIKIENQVRHYQALDTTRVCLICITVTHDFHNIIIEKCRSVQDRLSVELKRSSDPRVMK